MVVQAGRGKPGSLSQAIACLGKALEFRHEDMKKRARNRRCRGECEPAANCRDCKSRGAHEFMFRLIRESRDALQAYVNVGGAAV